LSNKFWNKTSNLRKDKGRGQDAVKVLILHVRRQQWFCLCHP